MAKIKFPPTTSIYVIKPFDPWRSRLCTCPEKYSFSPYTGCGHGCLYCYITSYIPNAFSPREKKNLYGRLVRELRKIKQESLLSISNSSDPYQPMEKRRRLMRKILPLLKPFRIQIVTKSDLVAEDSDVLRDLNSAVSITVTTLDRSVAKKMEPQAPPPEKRISALKTLSDSDIPVSARIDPVIPYINEDVEELVDQLSEAGVRHITSSTYKMRWDSLKRIREEFPEEGEKLKELYLRGERTGNTYYLEREIRIRILKNIRDMALKHGMSFACCREGLNLNTGVCDGSHLIGVKK